MMSFRGFLAFRLSSRIGLIMKTIKLILDTHVRVKKSDIKSAGVSLTDFKREFVYDNPEFHKTQRMGYFAGNIPRTITLLETDGDELKIPRGAFYRVRQLLEREGIKPTYVNRTCSGTGPIEYEFNPPFELGVDQRMAVKLLLGHRQGIIVGPCASGKTTIALAALAQTKERAIVIVHTERILETWLDEAHEFFGGSVFAGPLYGRKKQPDADLVIATVQTLKNYIEKNPKFVKQFGVCILDEAHHCFSAGTLVGDKPIESLNVGDVVPSFDEKRQEFTYSHVKAVMRSKPKSLYRIRVAGEDIYVTKKHPIYVDGKGWVEVQDLSVGDMVLSFTKRKEYSNEAMPVWTADSREGHGKILQGVSGKTIGAKEGNDNSHLRYLREDISKNRIESSTRSKGGNLLQQGMFINTDENSCIKNNEENQFKASEDNFQTDERIKSDEGSDHPGKSISGTSAKGVEATNPRREWEGSDGSPKASSIDTELGYGNISPDGALNFEIDIPPGLQIRYWKSTHEDWDRDRRTIPQITECKGQGSEKDRVIRITRVEDIEILKPGSDGTYGGCCPGGYVYNIEVEKTETYLVGKQGFVVHNCAASTFSNAISKFPARFRWAFTATPKRKDGKQGLFYDAFGSTYGKNRRGKDVPVPKVLIEIKDEDLDKYGRIIPVDVVVVPTKFRFDLNHADRIEKEGLERKAGESAIALARRWAKRTNHLGSMNTYSDMLDEMSRCKKRQARILEFLLPELKAKQPSILLADRRELCLETQHWLKRRNIECGRLMGTKDKKEQEKTAKRLTEGDLLAAVGTTVADEGMNVKPLSRGFGMTPTASNPGRLTQQFGRLKRKSPGKVDAIYYYFWDRNIKSLSSHLREIHKTIQAPHRIWYADKPGRSNWISLTPEALTRIERGIRNG